METGITRNGRTLPRSWVRFSPRQDEPWRLIYALMDDIYSAYWRQLRGEWRAGRAADRLYPGLGPVLRPTDRHMGEHGTPLRRVLAKDVGDALGMTKQDVQQRFCVKSS